MSRLARLKPYVLTLVLVLLLSNAGISTANVVGDILDGKGEVDIYAYWYYGHYVRQGVNPYRAVYEPVELSSPLTHLDSVTLDALPPIPSRWSLFPSNTAPMVLLLTSLSFFSWPVARLLWAACNLALMLAIPWLAIRLLPDGRLTWAQKGVICLSFYGFQGVPTAISVGQTTFLVIALMLGTLLALRKGWLLPGLLLGVALSKYTLAVPVLLLVLFWRRWRVAATALAVQVLAMLAVSGLDAPLLTVTGHLRRVGGFPQNPGIHLSDALGVEGAAVWGVAAVLTLAVFGLLWHWWRRAKPREERSGAVTFTDWHVLAILVFWALLVIYHRPYDTPVTVVFVALAVYGLANPALWNLSEAARAWVAVFLGAFVAALSLPTGVIERLLPRALAEAWPDVARGLMTAALFLALACTFWLLGRVREPKSPGA